MANKNEKTEMIDSKAGLQQPAGVFDDKKKESGGVQEAPVKQQTEKAVGEKAQPADTPRGFCVYLGPSIHGVIVHGTVYNSHITTTLQSIESILKDYPLVAGLIVPGEGLSRSLLELKTPGNLLFANYKRFVQELKIRGGKTYG